MVLMSYFNLPARAAGRGGEREHGDWLSSWWTCFPRLSTLTLTHAMPSETDRGSLSKLSLISHSGPLCLDWWSWFSSSSVHACSGSGEKLVFSTMWLSSFYFLPKKERRLQISYKRAAIYQMISRSSVWYKEARLGKQDQDRALLLSKLCFPMSSVSSNGHVYFICTDAWIVTHVHYMHNIVYARTRIIVFSVPMKYLHWIRFGCGSVVELALYKDLGLIPSNRN